jgi:hypothetical protein
MNNEKLNTILLAFTVVMLASILLAFPTMWLWNTCLKPAVDDINSINFLQALGLNVLFSILFKSNSVKSNNG